LCNEKSKLKRCSMKECCKQCRQVTFKGTMTKRPVLKQTHKTSQKRVIAKTQQTFRIDYVFAFHFFFHLWFLKWFLQEMLSNRLGTDNDFYCFFLIIHHLYNAILWQQRYICYFFIVNVVFVSKSHLISRKRVLMMHCRQVLAMQLNKDERLVE